MIYGIFLNQGVLGSLETSSMLAAAGGQFLDMGALEFAPRTDVNESLTMGYKEPLHPKPLSPKT